MNKAYLSFICIFLGFLSPLSSNQDLIVEEGIIEHVTHSPGTKIIVRSSETDRKLYWKYDFDEIWQEGDHVRVLFNPLHPSESQTIMNLSNGTRSSYTFNGWVSPETYQIIDLTDSKGYPIVSLDDNSVWKLRLNNSHHWKKGDTIVKWVLGDFTSNPFPLKTDFKDLLFFMNLSDPLLTVIDLEAIEQIQPSH